MFLLSIMNGFLVPKIIFYGISLFFFLNAWSYASQYDVLHVFEEEKENLFPQSLQWEDNIRVVKNYEKLQYTDKSLLSEFYATRQKSHRASQDSLVISETCIRRNVFTLLAEKLSDIESCHSTRQQLIVFIDHSLTNSTVDIWSLNKTFYYSGRKEVDWKSLYLEMHYGTQLVSEAFFFSYVSQQLLKSPEVMIAKLKDSLHGTLRNLTQAILQVQEKNPLVYKEVPVIFRSSCLQDLSVAIQENIMYAIRRVINEYRDSTNINIFTTPMLTRSKSGTVEGIEAFYGANFETMIKNTRTKKLHSLHSSFWEGILDIRKSTVYVAFPIHRPTSESLVRTVDLRVVDPSSSTSDKKYTNLDDGSSNLLFPQVSLFTTRFVNYGSIRSLALLVKRYCAKVQPFTIVVGDRQISVPAPLVSGICYFPCFNKGWKQECRVGAFTFEKNETTNESEVKVLKNSLSRPSAFCDESLNQALRLARLREICMTVGLSPNESESERIKISNCSYIVGTGDPELCDAIVRSFIFSVEFPANQDATYAGTAIPLEIGNTDVLQMINPLRVSGPLVVDMIRLFFQAGWLKLSYQNYVIQHLLNISTTVCKMKVNIKNLTMSGMSPPHGSMGEFPHQTYKLFPLTTATAYMCFGLHHLIHLLRAVGVKDYCPNAPSCPGVIFDVDLSPSVEVQKPTLHSRSCKKIKPERMPYISTNGRSFRKSLGVLLRTLLGSEFSSHIYTLGAIHWKGPQYISSVEKVMNE